MFNVKNALLGAIERSLGVETKIEASETVNSKVRKWENIYINFPLMMTTPLNSYT